MRKPCSVRRAPCWIHIRDDLRTVSAFACHSGDGSLVLASGDAEKRLECYRELRVWQSSVDLVVEIYKLTDNFPHHEIYALVQQMRRATVSIPSNIAEGHGRKTPREFAMFLRNANGSLRELETQLIIAEKLGYLRKIQLTTVGERMNDIARMLHGLMRYEQEC